MAMSRAARHAGVRAAARAAGRRQYCTSPYCYVDDIDGKGILTGMIVEQGAFAGAYHGNRDLSMRPRMAGLEQKPNGAGEAKWVTTPSGMRIVTQDSGAAATSVGFYIDAGAMYESEETAGTSHYVHKMLFSSNLISSDYHMWKSFQHWGVNYRTGSLGKRWIYAKVECRRDQVKEVVQRLCEGMFVPRFAPWELRHQREMVESESVTRNHDSESFVRQKVTETAFQGTGYGNPEVCPTYNTENIQSKDLIDWWASTFVPQRIQLVGVNVSSEELALAYSDAEWSTCNASSSPSHDGAQLAIAAVPSGGGYLGGEFREYSRDTEKYVSEKWYDQVTVAYGRKCYGRGDVKEYAAALVVGAASASSSSAPLCGDGAQALVETFDGIGVVGGLLRCRPGDADAAVRELAAAVNSVGQLGGAALDVAKKRAKIDFGARTETRDGMMDFIAGSSGGDGSGYTKADMIAAIGAVTAEDMKKVGDVMQSAPPTLVAFGDLATVPFMHSL